ncbi:9505_t:CDS:2, partial [Cetraspora pellucida]
PEKNKPTEEIRRWLTDKEIDWATDRLSKDKRFKFLPAHQFHLVKEAKRATDPLIFKELLKEINDSSKELVFIPVKEKKFWHWDTLGGANYQYVQPLASELLEQIRQVRNVGEEYLGRYLIKQHELRQDNGSDWGIDFKKEREELRKEYLAERDC